MADSSDQILCYGGSFNPIHHGHLLCAQAVAERANFRRVLLIPSGQPPHRDGQKDMASAVDRLTMCQLAVRGMSQFDVSDVELRRAGPSFTVDTARALKREGLPDVYWLIGADTLPQLPTWHVYRELLREVRFVVVQRPGYVIRWETLDPAIQPLRQSVVDAPLIDISASDVRTRVTQGLPVDFHVPPEVARYIGERGLYR